MKKSVWLVGCLMVGFIFIGCDSKGGNKSQGHVKEQMDSGKALALKFLQGIQDNDKNKMYEATSLTEDLVNVSREKLIHARQEALTEQQRIEFEHALRLSGQIDFFISKIRPMFPKSSRFEISGTTDKSTANDADHFEHLVKITYLNRDEAMRDKKIKPVREMVVHIQQRTRSVNGHAVHSFSFDGKDFDKIAEKDFEVLSYFDANK